MVRYFLALLVLIPVLALPAEAAAYDCNSSGDNHCYGVVRWNGNVTGSTVKIRPHPNGDMNNGNWFITNEMWLADYEDSATSCTTPYATKPFMEVGIIALDGRLRYFWAECAPGRSFVRYLRNDVPSNDFFKQVYFKINRSDKIGGEDDYKIWIASPTLGTITGYSYNNHMDVPDAILIGIELGADSGGYWNVTSFKENRYIQGGGYYYQHRDGDTKQSDNPPEGFWGTVPAPGNQGGLWWTRCLC